jgi:cell wall-associated NlpC family hydrolase
MNVTRADVVKEALTWLRTPFHHHARIKGHGVDCVNLLIGVYSNVGLIPAIKLDHYAHDWHLHSDMPLFLDGVLGYADRTDERLPGDVVMFRYGRQPAHGGIVIEWPVVIHAWLDTHSVELTEADQGKLGGRFYAAYKVKGLST